MGIICELFQKRFWSRKFNENNGILNFWLNHSLISRCKSTMFLGSLALLQASYANLDPVTFFGAARQFNKEEQIISAEKKLLKNEMITQFKFPLDLRAR